VLGFGALPKRTLLSCFFLIRFALATSHRILATCRHENLYVINHNSVRNSDRDFLIRANFCHVAPGCNDAVCRPTAKCNRSDA